MKSPLFLTKLFCRALVAAIFVAIFSVPTLAQAYQVQPDGSLMSVPRGYVNPYFQRPTYQPQIYPGQIINGERVVAPSVSPQQQGQPEAVKPPQPPTSSSDQKNRSTSQQSKRPDTIPRTLFPIPKGPSSQLKPVAESAAATTDDVSSKAPLESESSIATEEENEPAQSLNPTEGQSASIETGGVEMETGDLAPGPLAPGELVPLMVSDNSDEADLSPSQVSLQEEMSSDTPSSRELSSDELPKLESPALETSSDELTLDALPIDEATMAEIKKIRDELGGGISDTLEGVDLMPDFGPNEISPALDSTTATTGREASSDDLFAEQLRSVMSEQEANGGSITGSHPATQAHRTPSALRQPTDADRTKELRACARELEQLASRLEIIEAYENADQLRRQATELWTTARQR